MMSNPCRDKENILPTLLKQNTIINNETPEIESQSLSLTDEIRFGVRTSPTSLSASTKAAADDNIVSRSEHPVVPSYQDFLMLKPVSRGAFGKVFLGCKKKNPNKKYAIKIMKKADMIHKNMVHQVIAERNALALSKSPYIVRLYYSLQSPLNIYLVMEYMIGGDVKSLLAIYGFFDEDMAVMYTAEVVLALEYLHNHGIVHRDLKPDNMLISSEGHIKLTDFGLSKVSLNRQINIGDVMNTPNVNNSKVLEDYLRTPGQILSMTTDFAFTMPKKPLTSRTGFNQSNNSPLASPAPSRFQTTTMSAVHFTPPPIKSLTPTLKESLTWKSTASDTSLAPTKLASRTLGYSSRTRTDSMNEEDFMQNSTPRSCSTISMGLQKSYAAQNLKSLREGNSTDQEIEESDTSVASIEIRRNCKSGGSPELNVKKLCFSTEDVDSGFIRQKRPYVCVEKSPLLEKGGSGYGHTGLTGEFSLGMKLGDEHRLKRRNSELADNDISTPSQKLDFSHVDNENNVKKSLDSSCLSDMDDFDHVTTDEEILPSPKKFRRSTSVQSDTKCDSVEIDSSRPETENIEKSKSSTSSEKSSASSLDSSLQNMSLEDQGQNSPSAVLEKVEMECDAKISKIQTTLVSQGPPSPISEEPELEIAENEGSNTTGCHAPLSSVQITKDEDIIGNVRIDRANSCPNLENLKVLRFASDCQRYNISHVEEGHSSNANDADVSDMSESIDNSMLCKPNHNNTSTDHQSQGLNIKSNNSHSSSDQCDNVGIVETKVTQQRRPLLPFKVIRFSSLPGCSSTDNESSGIYSTPMRGKNENINDVLKTPARNCDYTPRRTPKSVRRGPPCRPETQGILGTPDYLAPELLLQKEHGPAVDWWALGVCLYEFLTGIPPFNDTTPERVFQNILHRDLLWPGEDESLSQEARDAIDSLLDMNPHSRIQAKGLKQLALMKAIDWDNLLSCTPQFVPRPDDDTDTTYFNARNTMQDLKVSAVDMEI